MNIPPEVLGLTAGAVIIWYVAEWRHCQEQSQSMNLVRNPLALFWLAGQRLWRNRRFVGILICCWLASVGIYLLILDPLVFAPARAQMEMRIAGRELSGQTGDLGDIEWEEGIFADDSGIAGKGPKYWVWRSLPQFRPVNLALSSAGFGIPAILVLGGFAAVLITLWFRRPKWLLPEVRQRLTWPIYLSVGGFLIMGTASGFGLASALSWSPEEELSIAVQVLFGLVFLVRAFATAALTAFLWHIILQVGSGRYWSPREAITGAVTTWLAIAWLSLVLSLPYAIPVFSSLLPLWHLLLWVPTLLRIALLFVPWIILAEGTDLLPAIRRNLLLIRSQWQDLLVMLPRYLLIVIPAYALLGAAGWPADQSSGAGTLVTLGCSTIELVLLVAIVVLYLELRKGEKAEPELQEVS